MEDGVAVGGGPGLHMKFMKLRVKQGRPSAKTKVYLDNANLGNICTNLSVNFRAGHVPVATVTLVPQVLEIESDVSMFVKIGEKKYRLTESEEPDDGKD